MYYQFVCGNFNVMSNINRKNITFTPEMLGKYYSEKIQDMQKGRIIQQDIQRKGTFLSIEVIETKPDGNVFLYLLKRENQILNFIKDNNGFRVDISEQELDKILKAYPEALRSLQARLSNDMTIEKMVPNIQAFAPILCFQEELLHTKTSGFDYPDYEYL